MLKFPVSLHTPQVGARTYPIMRTSLLDVRREDNDNYIESQEAFSMISNYRLK